MEFLSQSAIDLLNYLLPGFVTAAVVFTLTPAPRPSPFERVVQALIFTMLVQVAVFGLQQLLTGLGSRVGVLGTWSEEVRLTWSVVLAVGLGLALAWAANTDKVHGILRKLRITCQTSYSSEWYGAFSKNVGYIVLHLQGRRRLLGWAVEWPSTPGKGHFVMENAEWLSDEIGGTSMELTDVNQVLIKAEDVEMVELMNVSDRRREGTNGRAKTTDAATTNAATRPTA
jgi:uncharacterized protein YwgA